MSKIIIFIKVYKTKQKKLKNKLVYLFQLILIFINVDAKKNKQ